MVFVGQEAFDRRRELTVVQIDFSAAFDHVKYSRLLFKFCDVGVNGVDFNVVACFLSGSVHRIVVNGDRNDYVMVVSGLHQGSVIGLLLINMYTSDLPYILENAFVGYADDISY